MFNQCQFIGNLGADPEIRNFANGGQVCNLRLACTEKWKAKDGERKERTEWVSVAVFSEGLIRVCEQYLRKGSKVFISGKMQTRKWQDQSGNDRYSTEVVLQGFGSTLTMLDGPSGNGDNQGQSRGSGYGGGGSGSYGGGQSANSGGGHGIESDDIPF